MKFGNDVEANSGNIAGKFEFNTGADAGEFEEASKSGFFRLCTESISSNCLVGEGGCSFCIFSSAEWPIDLLSCIALNW